MAGRLGQPAKFLVVGDRRLRVKRLRVHRCSSGSATWYLAASVLAYLLSNAAMYVGNRYFTFRLSHDGFVGAYLRYLAVGGVVAGLTVVLLGGFVEGLGMDPRSAQALALSLLVPISFVLSKRFAFQLSPA